MRSGSIGQLSKARLQTISITQRYAPLDISQHVVPTMSPPSCSIFGLLACKIMCELCIARISVYHLRVICMPTIRSRLERILQHHSDHGEHGCVRKNIRRLFVIFEHTMALAQVLDGLRHRDVQLGVALAEAFEVFHVKVCGASVDRQRCDHECNSVTNSPTHIRPYAEQS